MSLKPYPEYKDSGVEWLGDIPRHWDIRPFFSVAKLNRKSNKGMAEKRLKSLSYGRIIRKDINATDGLLPKSFETYQIIEADDLVFRLTDLQNDKRSLRSAIVEERGIITSAYLSIRPEGCLPKFLSYAMRDADVRKVFYSMGGGLRQSMNYDDMKWLPVVFPPIEEQQTIVNFLDGETAEIDAFIADQERLIELLEERRTATITHAVTKGLDPNAPMKDSGIDWLGASQIPAAWRSWKMSHLLRLQSGDSLTSQSIEESGTYSVYGGGGFRGYTDTFTNDGDHALIGRQGALCGNIRRATGKFFATEHAIVVYPLQNLSTLWLTAILQTMNLGQYSQSAAQPGISIEVISHKKLPVPPLREQIEIANFLDREMAEFDAAVGDAREAIVLSRERRAALISAAVTGQIDVSQAQRPTVEVSEEEGVWV